MYPELTNSDKLKVVLAIAMLLCLLDMPYWYYQLVRIGSAIGFGYRAFSTKNEEDVLRLIYIGLAILFQPLIKISLGRTLWNIVDVMVAIWLVYGIYNKPNNQDSSK